MRMLLIEGLSRHDVMTLMTRQLCAAFNEIGVEARAAPAGPATLGDVLAREFVQGGFDGVFSFAGFGADAVAQDGRSLYAALPYGFTSWNVDHPAYQYARTIARLSKRLTLCASEDHFRFIELMGGRGRKRLMLPGAVVDPHPTEWRKRPLEVLVAMSWMGRPERWWQEAKGTPAHALMEAMLERLMADPKLNVLSAYRGAIQITQVRIPFGPDISNLIARLITYVRQLDRIRLVQGLMEAGVRFTLCGEGWDSVLNNSPSVTVLPSTDMAGLTALYGRSKVVLNLNAANGASERALSAFGAGAAVVSDEGALLAESFGDAIEFYDRTNVANTIGAVSTLLEGRGEDRAEEARQKVLAHHQWINRAQTIVDALSEH